MGKVNITEEEICKKECDFYLGLHAKVAELNNELHGINFPIERLEKDERMPMEAELLDTQFKALRDNIMRICGEMNYRAYHKK